MEKEPAVNRGRSRQEKKLDEILKLTKENSRMLRGEKVRRNLKAVIVIIILIGSSGYGYHLFQEYRLKIIEAQQNLEELGEHLEEAKDLGKKVGETTDSIKAIFAGQEIKEGER